MTKKFQDYLYLIILLALMAVLILSKPAKAQTFSSEKYVVTIGHTQQFKPDSAGFKNAVTRAKLLSRRYSQRITIVVMPGIANIGNSYVILPDSVDWFWMPTVKITGSNATAVIKDTSIITTYWAGTPTVVNTTDTTKQIVTDPSSTIEYLFSRTATGDTTLGTVDITDLTTNQILIFDGTNWVNATLTEANIATLSGLSSYVNKSSIENISAQKNFLGGVKIGSDSTVGIDKDSIVFQNVNKGIRYRFADVNNFYFTGTHRTLWDGVRPDYIHWISAYNMSPTGARVNTSDAAFGVFVESAYLSGADTLIEFNWETTLANGTNFRPYQASWRRDVLGQVNHGFYGKVMFRPTSLDSIAQELLDYGDAGRSHWSIRNVTNGARYDFSLDKNTAGSDFKLTIGGVTPIIQWNNLATKINKNLYITDSDLLMTINADSVWQQFITSPGYGISKVKHHYLVTDDFNISDASYNSKLIFRFSAGDLTLGSVATIGTGDAYFNDLTLTDGILTITDALLDPVTIQPIGGISGATGIRTGETVQVEGDSPSFGFKIGANISDIVPPATMTGSWDWGFPDRSGTIAMTDEIIDTLSYNWGVMDTVIVGSLPGWKLPNNITIVEIAAYTDANTVTFNIEERAQTTPNTAGTDAMSSDLVADNDQQESTSFTNANFDKDTWMVPTISATGDVSIFSITVKYIKR